MDPGAPDGDGEPVESLINNTKWNGNREGTTIPVPGSTSNGRGLLATETPREGSTEVWEVANLTGDAHPIHIHLIQFQVISRQPFDVDTYVADWIAAFPGGTFNGFTFAPGVYIPGFGPPLQLHHAELGRCGRRQPELRRREVPAAGRLRAAAPARRARPTPATPDGRTRSRRSPARSPASRSAGRPPASPREPHNRDRISSRSIRPMVPATSSTATSWITKTTNSCVRC